MSYGFAIMNDIHMEDILIFSKKNFKLGESVVIEFLIPNRFILGAVISYTNYYGMRSRIISDSKPEYRIKADFTHGKIGERTELRSFLKSIEPDLPPPPKAAKKTDEEDDDLSELGF